MNSRDYTYLAENHKAEKFGNARPHSPCSNFQPNVNREPSMLRKIIVILDFESSCFPGTRHVDGSSLCSH